jgi:hypothetical protein
MSRFEPEFHGAGNPGKAFSFIAPPIGGFLFLALLTLIATTTYDTAMMQTHYAAEAAWANAISPSPRGAGVL